MPVYLLFTYMVSGFMPDKFFRQFKPKIGGLGNHPVPSAKASQEGFAKGIRV